MVTTGAYCLCIQVHREISVQIGALGLLAFPEGKYIYVGSALNSLTPRINRHLKTSQGKHHVTHWHIDYLLREPTVSIQAVYAVETDKKIECAIAEKVGQKGQPVKGFGCSDCVCVSHLYKVDSFGFLEKIGLKKISL
ncbi:DUF123 domain-containing protein [Candidatus Bathyarchaeota archaeon]|nr:DUF123 domain-containing protein [Candidatus Bathyarchaeota archaeon]